MLKSLVQHIDSTFELEEFRADSFVKRVDAAVRAGGLVRGQLCCITKPVGMIHLYRWEFARVTGGVGGVLMLH